MQRSGDQATVIRPSRTALSRLQRGYALLTDSHGHAVTSVGQARLGDALRATLADGVLDVTVDQPRLL